MNISKKEITQNQNVIYVKFSEYYIRYLTTRYGSPVVFPTMSACALVLERYLLNNPVMSSLTEFCYSKAAFHAADTGNLFSAIEQRTPIEERELFIPIVIPDELIRTGQTLRTGSTWQLTFIGARALRKEVKRDLWVNFSRFNDDCAHRASRLGEKVTLEEVLSDFIVMYNIDMKEYTNMLRYWYRIQSAMKSAIERNREFLEDKTGNTFVYTP